MRCWQCNARTGKIVKIMAAKAERAVCPKCKEIYFPELPALVEIGNSLPPLGECPDCGKKMRYKRNTRTGIPFAACLGYPACRHTESADLGNCPDCGSKRVYRFNSRRSTIFIGCSSYPDCKCVQSKDVHIKDLPP